MIYLDNSATTKVSRSAAQKAAEMMTENFGNPSSLHSLGFAAEKEIILAKERVAAAALTDPTEIFFTSGGTESNNTAVFGAASALKRFGNKIVTLEIEHPSVLEPVKALEKQGFDVAYVKSGDIINNITADTVLVSVMSVNNETGELVPLQGISQAIKAAGSRALFHVDNVQGFGKISLKPRALGIDLMSLSSHKIHGPKGVGALFIGKGKRLAPMLLGGGQEKGIRSGTENTPGIAAMGVAAAELKAEPHVKELNSFLRAELLSVEDVLINSPENSSPYILNFSLGKVRGETMLHFLVERDIYVSTGSACSGKSLSHVLTAMGFDKKRVESSLRVSFSGENTADDVRALIEGIKLGLKTLSHR